MNTGKTLFAQLMDFLPWTTFTRIVDRYGGDHRVRTLSCAEQYRSMAFAQLTYRESLRDIETCLSVHASKLYHMGFRQPVRRRWPMPTKGATVSMRRWPSHPGRTLYVDEELGLDLTNTVYALDSTTIALCLSVHVGALPHHQGGGFTLLDPGQHSFSDGKLHDHGCSWEAGAIYVVDRGYVDFARLLCPAPSRGLSRVPSRTSMLIVYRRRRIARPASFATRPSPWTASTPVRLPRTFSRRFKDPESGKTLVFITNNFSLAGRRAAMSRLI